MELHEISPWEYSTNLLTQVDTEWEEDSDGESDLLSAVDGKHESDHAQRTNQGSGNEQVLLVEHGLPLEYEPTTKVQFWEFAKKLILIFLLCQRYS